MLVVPPVDAMLPFFSCTSGTDRRGGFLLLFVRQLLVMNREEIAIYTGSLSSWNFEEVISRVILYLSAPLNFLSILPQTKHL